MKWKNESVNKVMFRYDDLEAISDRTFQLQFKPANKERDCPSQTSAWLRCSAKESEKPAEPFVAELVENEVKDELTLRLRPTPVTSELFISYYIYKHVGTNSDWSALQLLALQTASIDRFCNETQIILHENRTQTSLDILLARNNFSGDGWLFEVEFVEKSVIFKLLFSFFTRKRQFELKPTSEEAKGVTAEGIPHFTFLLHILLLVLPASFFQSCNIISKT